MRADRLVAVLLLLQRRQHVTAAEVAAELEISERTARRDLDALAVAGLPVYSTRGRHGGWRLAGGGRTDLSGLTAAEARAMFLVAGPAASSTPELRSALRKLVRALPEQFRSSAEAATSSILVDAPGWDARQRVVAAPPLLDVVQRGVVDGERLEIGYVARAGEATVRVVDPLGLVTKGPAWYLIAGTAAGQRTFRVDRITAAEPLGEPVVRPDGFDVAVAWAAISDEIDRMRTPVAAGGMAEPGSLGVLRRLFGTRVAIGAALDDGRVEVRLRGHSIRSLAGELAGMGALVEVTEPPELRDELHRIGAELTERYRPAPVREARRRAPARGG